MATKASKVLALLRRSRAAARRYDAGILRVVSRVLRLMLWSRFSEAEVFVWGLADPSLTGSDLRRYVSKEHQLAIQRTINPAHAAMAVEDKRLFHACCVATGVPTPTQYASLTRGYLCASGGDALSTAGEVEDFLDARLPQSFVVKPAGGVYGRGVARFERVPGGWRDHGGRTSTSAALASLLRERSMDDTLILQERLDNAPSIVALTGCDALQTVRMVSFVDPSRGPRLLFATWKIIVGESLTDHYAFGRTGNMLANVRLDDGTVERVQAAGPDAIGQVGVGQHPRTGRSFADFRLPDWAMARAAVLDAALKFLPLIAVGWDVALTPDGPRIVEGNATFDPLHNAHGLGPIFLDAVTSLA
ncbi:MAG: sugar-transfer associated ATP-grasp domain-containing protein [Alphaproteobacteria bacterium]